MGISFSMEAIGLFYYIRLKSMPCKFSSLGDSFCNLEIPLAMLTLDKRFQDDLACILERITSLNKKSTSKKLIGLPVDLIDNHEILWKLPAADHIQSSGASHPRRTAVHPSLNSQYTRVINLL